MNIIRDSRWPGLTAGLSGLPGALLFLDLPTLAKLLALGACLILIVVGGPISGICVVAAALSVSALTINIGSSEWSPLELALIACGLSVALQIAIDLVRNPDPRVLRNWIEPVDITFIAVVLAALATISMLWVADSDLRSDSLRSLRRVILEPMIVIPALAFSSRLSRLRWLVYWLAWPAILVAGLAILQVLTQRSTVDIGGVARPIGTFTHPNNLAFYLERAIWFSPLLACMLKPRFGRWSWLIPGVMLSATLVTLSRGAAIALGAGCLVMFWDELRERLRLFVGLMVAAGFTVFASRYLAESGDSVDTRTTVWRAAVDMIRDHPFTGVGLDQFLGQYGRRYVRPEGWPERYTSHPHNAVLDFWLSLGVGGLAIVWLLLEAGWRRIVVALHTPAWSINRAAMAMIVAGFAHGMIDNSFFLPYLATLTWIGLTLGLAPDEASGGD